MWTAVHPDLTEKLRIPDEIGPEFELQFWPPKIGAGFSVAMSRVTKDIDKLDPVKDYARVCEISGLDWRAMADMARFGVRGWSDMSIECQTEVVEVDGRKHTVLTEESVQILHASALLFRVATKCNLYNRLDPDQKKTLPWRSGFPTLNTNAASADLMSASPADGAEEASSDSTASPTSAVPST